MDLAERIARRRVDATSEDLVANLGDLDPGVHLAEPVGRGPVFEQLLDAVEPVLTGDLPSNVVVHGPAGAGKSAVLVSLLSTLSSELSESRGNLYTTTRGGDADDHVRFAYVDACRAGTRHKLYYSVLESLTHEAVPERGIGTETLGDRIQTELANTPGAVVAVDHVDENDELRGETLADVVAALDNTAWITVGREDPDSLAPTSMTAEVRVPPYQPHDLVDLLTVRANQGLTAGMTHGQARRIGSWTEGNAHDALVCLFTAAVVARDAGHAKLNDADVQVAIEQTSRDTVPIGRVFALSENRQAVLEHLLALPDARRTTIEETAAAIAENSPLTQTTVRRFLYELADQDVLEKVSSDATSSNGGRPPARLETRFPETVFQQLRK